MHDSPLVQMDVAKEVRVKRLVSEYGPADREEFLNIMGKIAKKLGGQNYNTAKEKLLAGDIESTIDILLSYYDKTYLGSMDKRKEQMRLTLPWDGMDATGYANQLIKQWDKTCKYNSNEGTNTIHHRGH